MPTRQLSISEYTEMLRGTSLTEDEITKVVNRLKEKGVWKNNGQSPLTEYEK